MIDWENLKGRMRAAFLMRELGRAQQSLLFGPVGLLIRTALAVVFMYLILISDMVMGTAGPICISLLFIFAYFVPALLRYFLKPSKGPGPRNQTTFNSGLRYPDQSSKPCRENHFRVRK